MSSKFESTDEAWESGLLGTSLEHAKPSRFQEDVMMTHKDIVDAWNATALNKLEKLLQDGWQVNGVSIEKVNEDGTISRGAVTTGGMVLWWNPESTTKIGESK